MFTYKLAEIFLTLTTGSNKLCMSPRNNVYIVCTVRTKVEYISEQIAVVKNTCFILNNNKQQQKTKNEKIIFRCRQIRIHIGIVRRHSANHGHIFRCSHPGRRSSPWLKLTLVVF